MPGEFLQGVRTAEMQNERNPFNIILNRFQEAQARRYKEDKERKKEEFELDKALQVLNKDYLYKQELEKTKAEEERKTKAAEREAALVGTQKLIETFKGKGQGETPSSIGMTGMSITSTGKPTFTFGETPQAKQERAVETAQQKKAATAKNEVQEIDNMVTNLFEAGNRLIPAIDDPKKAELVGAARSAGAMSLFGLRPQRALGLSDENVIAYNEIMKAEATPIIRSMGEKGMLTNQDIQRALGLFPKNSDSTQLRNTRKRELSTFLRSKVKAYYKEGANQDISEEDIQYTMQKHGLSREEVLKRLGK